MPVKVTKDRVAEAMAAIKAIASRRVLVGIPADKDPRKPDPTDMDVIAKAFQGGGRGMKPDPLGNAALGYLHEKGVPDANIPARPWLGPGMANAEPKIAARMRRAGAALLTDAARPIDATLTMVGLESVDTVREKLRDGPFAPLAPRTLADRRRHGFKGIKPLIRTGQLIQSVNFVLRDAK